MIVVERFIHVSATLAKQLDVGDTLVPYPQEESPKTVSPVLYESPHCRSDLFFSLLPSSPFCTAFTIASLFCASFGAISSVPDRPGDQTCRKFELAWSFLPIESWVLAVHVSVWGKTENYQLGCQECFVIVFTYNLNFSKVLSLLATWQARDGSILCNFLTF